LSLSEAEPLASLVQRFGSSGFTFNRAAAASLMLRYGWGAGFIVTTYLAHSRVPFLRIIFPRQSGLNAIALGLRLSRSVSSPPGGDVRNPGGDAARRD
jgi:hypothetical protein